MAASRLDMFWAEATDVNAATESPTKSARESLFAYLMTPLHLLRRFQVVQYILFFSAEAMSGSKADIDHAALTYRDGVIRTLNSVCRGGEVDASSIRSAGSLGRKQYCSKIREGH